MSRLILTLRAIRFTETIPFCGVAVFGGLLAQGTGDFSLPIPLILSSASVFFLAAFGFTFNDLQDVEHDRRSGVKSNRPLVDRSLTIRSAGILTATLAITGIVLLAIGTPWHVLCAGIITLPLSALYSWRRLPLKTIPVFPTLIHLIQGTLVFLLGAWVIAGPDPVFVLIGSYFGLLFAAGHLHHEVLDLEVDRVSGLKTHAVRFGVWPTLWAGFLLWCLSGAGFSALCLLDLIPAALGWIQLGMFSCYLIGFLVLLKRGFTQERMKFLQKLYRGAYAAGGLVMVLLLVVERARL